MQPDDVIQAQIDDLLRIDTRLQAAAPLIGQVFALITEPKPPSVKKTKRPRKAPPRVATDLSTSGGTTTVTFHASDAATLRDAAAAMREHVEGGEEDEQAAPHGPAPWLKFCKVKKVPAEYRALFGDKALAVVVVDGWLWARADAETRRAGLVLALRGLEHQERAVDGADMCKRTAPPLQTWPDCVDELSHLVAAFTDDPKSAAEDSRGVEAMSGGPLQRELARHERLLAEAEAEFAEYDNSETMHLIDVLNGQISLLHELIAHTPKVEPKDDRAEELLRAVVNTLLDAHGLPPLSDLLGPTLHDKVCAAVGLDCGLTGDEGHDVYGTDPEESVDEDDLERARAAVVQRRDQLEIDLVIEDDGLQNVEISWERDDETGWTIYEGGDLHDGFRSLDEVCSSWGKGVYLSRADYKADRSISIRAVLQALRLEAGLPAEWSDEDEPEGDAIDRAEGVTR